MRIRRGKLSMHCLRDRDLLSFIPVFRFAIFRQPRGKFQAPQPHTYFRSCFVCPFPLKVTNVPATNFTDNPIKNHKLSFLSSCLCNQVIYSSKDSGTLPNSEPQHGPFGH
jgi:hypothetical protein